MLRLTLHCEGSVKRFSLPRTESVLGSSPTCDLVAPFPGVSRRHATLRRLDGGVLVTDLESKNGLIKDGSRLAEVLLRPCDRIRIGRAWLELEEIDSEEAALGIPFPDDRIEAPRSAPTDTDALGDSNAAHSPAGALRLVRAVETAGRLALEQPDEARALLELALTTLDAASIWIWADRGSAPPAIVALAGELPDESGFAALAAQAHRTAGPEPSAEPVVAPGCLVAPLTPGSRGLVALLRDSSTTVPTWKVDLFQYLAAHVVTPPRAAEPRQRPRPRKGGDLVFPDDFVHGESPAMAKLLQNLAISARSRLDVLLLGETGTGKELIAKAIHLSGPTSKGPFLAINCAAIPTELLEAQLFGVEARVATGVDPRPGLFLKADGGSLFLDEIGDLPEPLQAKLLRAIQEREILLLGATRPRKIDVRVISASNKDLGDLVRQGKFRADLYYRLRGLQFHLPPLRDRKEDLPFLVLAFARRAAAEYEKAIAGVSRKALALLSAYDWPGNVRELKSEVERAVLLCPDHGALESSHFGPVLWLTRQSSSDSTAATVHPSAGPLSPGPAEPSSAPPRDTDATDLRARIESVERTAILGALADCRGNRSKAARRLGITRNGLALKMKRLGLD